MIKHVRENCKHPKLTNDSALLLKNYFMSINKQKKTKVPIIAVDTNMFKTMLKLSQVFAKFRNSDEVEECDYRMMEVVFENMLYPQTE